MLSQEALGPRLCWLGGQLMCSRPETNQQNTVSKATRHHAYRRAGGSACKSANRSMDRKLSAGPSAKSALLPTSPGQTHAGWKCTTAAYTHIHKNIFAMHICPLVPQEGSSEPVQMMSMTRRPTHVPVLAPLHRQSLQLLSLGLGLDLQRNCNSEHHLKSVV